MENYYGINRDHVKKLANSVAKNNYYGKATSITFKNVKKPEIGETISHGHRKYTTGEYVPNAYLQNFGWKNTFYQKAKCEVILPLRYKKIYYERIN